MKKLCVLSLLSVFLALPAFAAAQSGQSTSGGFNFSFIQQLVWSPATISGKTICTPSASNVCQIPVVLSTAETVNLAVAGGTPPYTWTAATLPTGVTIGTSTGLTNVINVPAMTTDPCPATGTCFTITVTDSSVVAQKQVLSFGQNQKQVAILLPPGTKSVQVNGRPIPVN